MDAQQKQELLDDLQEILNRKNKTPHEILWAAADLMWQNEVYGCTDPNASNYCSTCIYSTDTCLYTAPPNPET